MPQKTVKTPRTVWTMALTSPKRSTTDANSAPRPYRAGTATRITPSARSASSGPMGTPKKKTSAPPTTANIQTAHTIWLNTGPNRITSRLTRGQEERLERAAHLLGAQGGAGAPQDHADPHVGGPAEEQEAAMSAVPGALGKRVERRRLAAE